MTRPPLRALATLLAALALAPSAARASDVELTDHELVLSVSTPTAVELAFAHAVAPDLLLTAAVGLALDAEGVALTVGVRPLLARVDDYRLIWIARAGPVAYGRDGASVGLTASTSLQNVVSLGPVRLMASPKVDFAGAWGIQDGWRTRVSLVLAAGLVVDWFSAWLGAEPGYTFGGYGPGAIYGAATLTLGIRFDALR